jgi:hypothetical protein
MRAVSGPCGADIKCEIGKPASSPNDPITSLLPLESEIEISDKQRQDMFDYIKKQIEGDLVNQLITRR